MQIIEINISFFKSVELDFISFLFVSRHNDYYVLAQELYNKNYLCSFTLLNNLSSQAVYLKLVLLYLYPSTFPSYN